MINIFLIIFSLILAVLFPFSWFLIAYAVIGPLHYLTEINWLNHKGYFVKSVRLPLIILICCTLFIVLPSILSVVLIYFGVENVTVNNILIKCYEYIPFVMFTALLFAIYSVYVSDRYKLFFGLMLCICISVVVMQLPFMVTVFGLFLPSLIHVYLFTGLFMLYGVIKQANKTLGLISVVLLFTIPVLIYLIPSQFLSNNVSIEVKQWYSSTSFGSLIENMSFWFKTPKKNESFYLLSELGIKLQVFVTFAYTYHYLNWFSKTTKIGWKMALSFFKIKVIAIIWVLSVLLYVIDFRLGLTVSLLLSFSHVIFEFPLNFVSLKAVVYYIFGKQ